MLAHARRGGDLECCGLLAGRGGEITHIFPATNALASATRFEIAPQELFPIFRAMRAAGLEHLGIYHSHPRGPQTPSPIDVEQCFYPEAAHFIVAGNSIRAFRIADAHVAELKIAVTDQNVAGCSAGKPRS